MPDSPATRPDFYDVFRIGDGGLCFKDGTPATTDDIWEQGIKAGRAAALGEPPAAPPQQPRRHMDLACPYCHGHGFEVEVRIVLGEPKWLIVCQGCRNVYELIPDGTIQLKERG
jgi:uncharacterized protein YbaR (Trm112 family)